MASLLWAFPKASMTNSRTKQILSSRTHPGTSGDYVITRKTNEMAWSSDKGLEKSSQETGKAHDCRQEQPEQDATESEQLNAINEELQSVYDYLSSTLSFLASYTASLVRSFGGAHGGAIEADQGCNVEDRSVASADRQHEGLVNGIEGRVEDCEEGCEYGEEDEHESGSDADLEDEEFLFNVVPAKSNLELTKELRMLMEVAKLEKGIAKGKGGGL